MDNLSLLATVLTSGVLTAISLLTITSNFRRRLNISFVLWLCSAIFWDVSLYFFYSGLNEDILLWLGRLNFVAALLIVIFAINFVNIFPDNKGFAYDKLINAVMLIGILLIGLTMFTSFTSEAESYVGNQIETTYGKGYFIYASYLVIGLALTTFILIFKYRASGKKIRSQILYFTVALIIPILWGLTTNVFLPLFGDFEYQSVGPLGTVIFGLYVGFAILRRQFLDVRVVMGRVAYYALLGSLFFITYFAIYFFDKWIFGSSTAVGAIVTGIINAIIFAIFFAKLNDYLRTQVRSKIINPGYDPLEVTDKLSRKLASMLNVREIVSNVLEAISQTIRPHYSAVYILAEKPKKQKLLIESSSSKKELDLTPLDMAVHIWKNHAKRAIVLDELRFEIPEVLFQFENEIRKLMKYMEDNKLKTLLPLAQEEEVLGVLLVGQKEADGMYTQQDVDFLAGLSTALGLSITRALYYLEVEDLNKNLQKRVNDATRQLADRNKRLTQALARIEDIRRQERDMVDVMGHELRTPITIVRNALSVLFTKLKNKEKMSHAKLMDYVDKALESARRELALVETLLSATKVESNRIQMTLTKVDAKDIINDAIEGHGHFAKEKGLKITINEPKKNVWCYVDRTRIQEAMDNLLSNAVKYTPEGGIDITLREDDKKVYIDIKDTGIGISEEDIKHLGKKFYRAKQHVPKDDGKEGIVRPGGTGLGLFVSFNLIRLMKGKIKIASKVGKGSTFTIVMTKFIGQKDKRIDQTFEQD